MQPLSCLPGGDKLYRPAAGVSKRESGRLSVRPSIDTSICLYSRLACLRAALACGGGGVTPRFAPRQQKEFGHHHREGLLHRRRQVVLRQGLARMIAEFCQAIRPRSCPTGQRRGVPQPGESIHQSCHKLFRNSQRSTAHCSGRGRWPYVCNCRRAVAAPRLAASFSASVSPSTYLDVPDMVYLRRVVIRSVRLQLCLILSLCGQR
jgi:hypothetical protein